eukprot:NODE_257_length_11653_cov_0.298858.p8 type:complete len:126 gc:universal NODE_257_length_11653_cov_0.298858:727-350(-)
MFLVKTDFVSAGGDESNSILLKYDNWVLSSNTVNTFEIEFSDCELNKEDDELNGVLVNSLVDWNGFVDCTKMVGPLFNFVRLDCAEVKVISCTTVLVSILGKIHVFKFEKSPPSLGLFVKLQNVN